MLNTIQSVFLSETHVFLSIFRLFWKMGVSKTYSKFKMLIIDYRSRFWTKFSTFLGFFYAPNKNLPFFYAPNKNPPFFFLLDLGNMIKKWFTRRYLIIGKKPLFGFYLRMGYLPVVKIKKFLWIRVLHAEKSPVQKISQIGKLFENSIFLPQRRTKE